MAMGKRTQSQPPLFLITADLPATPAHPFYQKLNQILAAHRFEELVQDLCGKFYHPTLGRPSLEPGRYFRLLLIGYFEGIDSERGIAWRCADSASVRWFVGYAINEPAADHSTISRNRRLIDLETHQEVFAWVLKVLAKENLLSGKTAGVDATTLEANAAMRSIIRRDTKETYDEFLTRLAKASGIDTPTREELAKLDKKRKHKASNDDWENPHDPDARITKMKDGRTHLAHKQEHAVDLESGAILAVTIQEADTGDTASVEATLDQVLENLVAVAEDQQAADRLSDDLLRDVVADKGYHSNQTMSDWRELAIRSYVSEPDRGRRDWTDKPQQQKAVYANRRRIRGNRGKRLLRKRGELIERSFAHVLETGGMRRTHLRGHDNILKRMLVHVGGFNLSLVMRKVFGRGTPRGLQGLRRRFSRLFWPIWMLWRVLADLGDHPGELEEFDQHFNPRRCVA